MVKSARAREPRFEVTSQVNLLASQFSNSVCLGGDRLEASRCNAVEMADLGSSIATQTTGLLSLTLSSPGAPTPAEAPAGVEVSRQRMSALGFEVDMTGSQQSETPFLRRMSKSVPCGMVRRRRFDLFKPNRSDAVLKAMEERFKKGRADRLSAGLLVDRLLRAAREKLLLDLSLKVPGSLELIKTTDPSGGGELVWSDLLRWLQGLPNLMALLKLTTDALALIASYNGPSAAAVSVPTLLLCAIVVCRLDADTYRGVCSFLFPEDDRFSEGAFSYPWVLCGF